MVQRQTSAITPKSLTHQHIFSVMHTRLQRSLANGLAASPARLRILDIGCGDGQLISYLQSLLDQHYPDTEIEVFGFDVGEVGYADSQQLPNTMSQLRRAHPHIDWSDRIHLQSVDTDWKFRNGFFDIAVSNQVLEHVDDLDHFLGNLKRVQKPTGFAVHVFPLKNGIIEGHTDMPFVHYIKDQESRIAFATFLNRIGLSRYRADREILGYQDPQRHARDSASFIQGYTCYRTFDELYRKCNEMGLSLSSHFTKDLYLAKLRQQLRLPPTNLYRPWNWFLMESVTSSILKYVSSVTLTTTRINYDIGERIRREKIARETPTTTIRMESHAA